MAWKKVSNADAGDATHFGGDDFDKVADLFSDVVNVDTVQINSTFELIASKFKIRDLTDETKELVFDVSAILTATTRTIIWPDSNLNFGSFPIANLDTDPLARANHTGTQLASTISDFDTQVRTSRLDQMASATSLITVAGIIETGRSQYDKGVDVASTTDMTLGIDGNVFDITGAVTIDHILNTNWQIGSVIVLHFVSTPTLTHNAGAEVGDEASLFLQGDSNFSASTGDILTFVLLESIQWQEISRNVAGAGAGDMILADAQTNTGIKTFLDTTMKLRNVANTFDAFFVNTVTADRIYTLPDAAGSIVITGLASQITIGTEVTGTSTALTDTGDIAYLNTPNTFIAGNLNTFSHDATNPGLSVLPIAGDPSARADGAIWLNVTSQQLFARINGSDVDLGAGAGGEIFTWTADHSQDTFKLIATAGQDVKLNPPTGQGTSLEVAGVQEYLFNAAEADFLGNNIRNVGFFESNAANPALSGTIRLGNLEEISWRNSANSADRKLKLDSGDFFSFDVSIAMNNSFIKDIASLRQNGIEATVGFIRMINNASVLWRNAANTANLGITINASNQLAFVGTTEIFDSNIFTNHPAIASVDGAADTLLIRDATDD